GEILALVNLGRTPGGGYAERENYAIGRNTEPGSTFKLASMLLLLDDADMPLDQTYDTGNGRVVKVGGIRVQDSHAGFNDMDFRTAVAQSSNVYFAKAIWERYADNKERYSDFMKKLHLDQTVGLEAFGEKTALSGLEGGARPQQYARTPLVRLSYQTLPIQVITLYNAIANDGK
ncbi:penicillin-binding protein, partial [human gut metagenome]